MGVILQSSNSQGGKLINTNTRTQIKHFKLQEQKDRTKTVHGVCLTHVCTCQDGFVGLKLLACHTQGTVCEAGVLPQAPQLIC